MKFDTMNPLNVVIAGGGLAGLACAKYLVDAGLSVEIFEGQRFLGGRASTYRDASGDWVEQGLHLFLGTYSELKSLLREIKQDPNDILFWMPEIRCQDTEGPQAVFGINPLRAPLRTILSVLGQNSYLGPIDKISIVPLMAPAVQGMETLQLKYDRETVTELWIRLNRNRTVFERFIRPLCRAIQFTDPNEFSAYSFLGWVHNILRDLPHSLAGGYRGAREEIIFQPLARYLIKRGTKIHTQVKLKKIEYSNRAGSVGSSHKGRINSFVFDGGHRVKADLYVVAIPAWEFVPLIPRSLQQHPFFSKIAALPVCPAISVQIWFNKKIIRTADFTLVANSRAAVYQDLSTNAYPYDLGSRVSVIVSPADDLMDESDEAILQMVLDSLSKTERSIVNSHVVKSVVLKHRHHLVRPLPGAMSLRPTQMTPVSNLFLAGDWTQQDYFGSQEGAVRSGKACAKQVLHFVTQKFHGKLKAA